MRRGVLVAFVAAGLALWSRPAAADTTTLNGTSSPIVRVSLRQGDITIRTWDRDVVQVDGDPSLTIERHTSDLSGNPQFLLIPGARLGDDSLELPPENFVAGPIASGPREVVVVADSPGSEPGAPPAAVVVTVPNDAAFVFARTGRGNLDVRDYRAGTLVGFALAGRMTLASVGGTVFAQTGRGPITVLDSTFDRVRARSLLGNITFERCRVRQIEVTAGAGSIVYDGGSFSPGLARFESERGNVAIGSDGPVQFGARAAPEGRVFTSFTHGAHVEGGNVNAAQATIGSGGPVVTATTQAGNVFLYDGSLRGRRLHGEWRAPLGTLTRPAVEANHISRTAPPRFGPPPHAGSPPPFEQQRAPAAPRPESHRRTPHEV